MKKRVLFLLLMAMLVIACQPDANPEPNPEENTIIEDSSQNVVKKYLTKQLYNDDPDLVMLAIDWNEDCTKINHVQYGTGNGICVDYYFNYYSDDSIRIAFSMPQFSYPLWAFWYDSVILHLRDNKIDSICCYKNDSLFDVEHYVYDKQDRLIERSYLHGTKDTFLWEENNVKEAFMFLRKYEFIGFTKYHHPHCNLPFYLSNFIAHEIQAPLFSPLWQNQPDDSFFEYETDEDHYVIKAIPKSIDGHCRHYYTYYYTTPTGSIK